MKNWILFGLAVTLATCAPATYTRIKPGGAYDYFKHDPTKTARISAHRGGGDIPGYPENCIESFQNLAKRMPVLIECDIDMTRDSVLVMMHDATLDRTTTGTGKLGEKTYAELAPLRLKDNLGTVTPYKIPTLDEVLRWGKGKVTFGLDVKRNVRFEDVVAAIRRAGAADYLNVITYSAADASRLHQLAPDLMISVTIRNQAEYQRLRDAGVPDNRMVAFVGVREPPKELYDFLHQKGIGCILGTLGNLDKQASTKGDVLYLKHVQNGADILSTDRPLEVWRVLK